MTKKQFNGNGESQKKIDSTSYYVDADARSHAEFPMGSIILMLIV